MKCETDIIHQVYNENGDFLQVRPWPDEASLVTLQTINHKGSQEMFGLIELVMTPDFAREIAKALIECADEVENGEQ